MNKIAIGSVQFGVNYGISNQKGIVEMAEVEAILNLAKKNGIDTIDTAKNYGKSEEVIGGYFKKYPKDNWSIITKITSLEKSLEDCIAESEKKLNMSLSAVLAHSSKQYLDKDFQKQAKVLKKKYPKKKIGVSLYTEKEIHQVLNSGFELEIIQLPMNILDTRLFHSGLLNQIFEKHIEIHARSVFLQGLFYLSKKKIKHRFPDAYSSILELESIAFSAGLTLAQLSLLWLLNLEQISKVIIGVENKIQLYEHLKTIDKKIDHISFKKALEVRFNNEKVLNPVLWN